jgi:aminoglycoside phosphotransferase (APT) family kinase protein
VPFDGTLPPDRGSPNRTHVFVFDDIVVKLSQQANSKRLIRERNALALLQTAPFQVPKFVAAGDGWIVMTRLAGEPPADAAHPPHEISTPLARQLGGLTAQLHYGPRPPGFGTWTEDTYTGIGEVGARVEGLYGLGVDAKIVERAELDHATDLLRDRLPSLASAPADPVLAHRDVQPRNVLVDAADTITALLDFEAAGGGDPAEDFKCVGLDWHQPGFAAFVRGYRDAGGEFDAAFAERAAFYVGYWALAALAYLGSFAPHFLPVARTAITRIERGEVPPL